MNIFIISLFPELVQQASSFGVLGRAIKQQQITLRCFNPRNFTDDKHHTVDDRPYGGGPGMLMKVEPLFKAIMAAKEAAAKEQAVAEQAGNNAKVVYMSPQGQCLNQQMFVNEAATANDLILIAGRYEGIDERIIESLVDEEWSIGDYVISGGEFAALVVVDAITRLLPGVLGDDDSALQDSFMQGLLDYPHYTRPVKIASEPIELDMIEPEMIGSGMIGSEMADNMTVPDVLLSGNHKAIQRWRLKQALGRTWSRRPELLAAVRQDTANWDDEKENLLTEFINESGVETEKE